MTREFYTRVLPTQGTYCVTVIAPNRKLRSHFVDTIDELIDTIEAKKNSNNVYFGLAGFEGASRKNAQHLRSFFVDLDVGDTKDFSSKEEAIEALDKFVADQQLPPPFKVDSGNGIHAYWMLDTDVPAEEWKLYAEKFKQLCLTNGFNIDPAVTADKARILRAPDTYNFKSNPPLPTKILDQNAQVYQYKMFQDFLGAIEKPFEEIIKEAKLTETSMVASGLTNYKSKFETIANKSLDESSDEGCAQIRHCIRNRAKIDEPMWYAGLSIAQHCIDRDTYIHALSEDYPGSTRENTERKANQTQGMPQSCQQFNNLNPGLCENCKHFGKITNPLALGKVFVPSVPTKDHIKRDVTVTNGLQSVATSLVSLPPEYAAEGYFRGSNGGIYFKPKPVYDENGQLIEQKEKCVTVYDFYALKRVISPTEGNCILMKYDPPHDKAEEFYIPFSTLYDGAKFREIIAKYGVLFDANTNQWKLIMDYLIFSGNVLQASTTAERVRTQMAWTPDYDAFVIGGIEIDAKGEERPSTPSPNVDVITQHLKRAGTYEKWKELMSGLEQDGFEIHSFVALAGLGSPLMCYTSTPGATISLIGDTGAGKTGALYAALSMWGMPKDLSMLETTDNAFIGRFLSLHNLPLGLDEVGNLNGRVLSKLIHNISQGKAKNRMQASINAERAYEHSASLVGIFTTNHSLVDKIYSTKAQASGEMARLIEFYLHKPKPLADDPSTGRKIFNPLLSNYGWAGPEFIKAVCKLGKETVEAELDKWVNRFKKDFGDDTAYRFYENLVATALTAGVIAYQTKILNFDVEKIYKKVISEMIDIRDNVIKNEEIDYIELIGSFLTQNSRSLLIIKDDNAVLEPLNGIHARIDVDDGDLSLTKSVFRKFLIEEHSASPKQFLFQMKEAGIIVEEKRKKMATKYKPGLDMFNVNAYIIQLDSLPDRLVKEFFPEPV
jgi:hypothetical protein